MKTLKFNHEAAHQLLEHQKTSTWRLYDDKDLSVDDHLKILDKVDPKDPKSWKVIGQAVVSEIIEKKMGSLKPQELSDEGFKAVDDALNTYQSYYGDRVDLDTPVKILYFSFEPTTGDNPSSAMLLDEARIYTDGGSRGNPGDSACAYAICKQDDSLVEKAGFYLGMATNNQAEYYGMKHGLERARDLGIDKVSVLSDSQLVVNQMKGLYKVKNQELAPLHQDVAEIARSFGEVSFTYVPRELNKIADSEVNRILDDQARKKSFKKHGR